MLEGLIKIEPLIFRSYGFRIINVTEDKECRDYYGFNFQLGTQHIKFRKAKLTPKKTGQFVTLWKRASNGRTVPYDLDDDFDFYIILTEYDHQLGYFVFPKAILLRMGILTLSPREGKRGFRVYPEWDVPVNSQGLKTKEWQKEYFIGIQNKEKAIEKLNSIFKAV